MRKKLKRKLLRFIEVVALIVTVLNGLLDLINKFFN